MDKELNKKYKCDKCRFMTDIKKKLTEHLKTKHKPFSDSVMIGTNIVNNMNIMETPIAKKTCIINNVDGTKLNYIINVIVPKAPTEEDAKAFYDFIGRLFSLPKYEKYTINVIEINDFTIENLRECGSDVPPGFDLDNYIRDAEKYGGCIPYCDLDDYLKQHGIDFESFFDNDNNKNVK